MSAAPDSEAYLRLALRLAARGRYRASPNPMVGAVVVRDGEIVGQGYHRRAGGPHAEVEALNDAGERARGGTIYVTLEPCNHQGRTPPCSERVLESGIRRVVACHRDPDPKVGGGGFARLREAGVEVESGILLEEAVRLNWRFLVSTLLGRPAVTLKWAMSLDGKIATVKSESQWISSPGGRRWGLDQRERNDAILIGSGTALDDDPRLNRRLGKAAGPNVRVVLDRRLRLSPEARLLELEGPVLVYTQADADGERRAELETRGATVVGLEDVEPVSVLADLHRRGVRSLLVEGGGTVAASFAAAGTFDRVGVDCAPMLIGGESAPGPLRGDGFTPLAAAPAAGRPPLVPKGRRRDHRRIQRAMFTGLVRELGRLSKDPEASGEGGVRLAIAHSEELSKSLEIGASLAVSGVCLTLVAMAPGISEVEMGPETLRRTTLGGLRRDSPINLEPALKMGDALGGHWVQGHVDTTLEVVSRRDYEAHREVGFSLPEDFASFVVEKGSVTLEGVSLTVSSLAEDRFEVALIPHTLEVTSLGSLEVGDRVNFEVDVLAKYVQRALATSGLVKP